MKNVRVKLNKKVLTLCGVAVLLIGAVITNLLASARKNQQTALPADASGDAAENASVSVSSTQGTFFEAFRNDRNVTREKEIAYIDAIIEQGADAETLAEAQRQKLVIVDYMEKEMTVENLLKAKGFADAAVSLHSGSVNVVLAAETLSDEQVAQVLDIVMRETGEIADNVKVTTAQ